MADRFLEAPPPRQRVVERGGRLVVIDGGVPAPQRARSIVRTGRSGFEKTSFDGRGVLNTQAWYDLKGPRRLLLDPWSARIARLAPLAAGALGLAVIGGAIFLPWLLVAVPALIQPKAWKNVRTRLTARLDRFPAA